MKELLKFAQLIFGAARETVETDLNNFYDQITNHPFFLYFWRRALVFFVFSFGVWAIAIVTWALFKDVDAARGAVIFAGIWGIVLGVVFLIFAAPLGVLVEAAFLPSLNPKKVGKQYVRHGANFLLLISGVALFLAVVPVKNNAAMFWLFLLAVIVAILSGKYEALRWSFEKMTFVTIVVALYSFFFPQDFAFLHENVRLDGHLQKISESGGEERVAAGTASQGVVVSCKKTPSFRKGAYQIGRGCYTVTIPAKGVTPVIHADTGGWWWDVRHHTSDISIVFSDGEEVFVPSERCGKPRTGKAGIFRIKGKPGTSAEVWLTPSPPPSCV